MTRLRDEQPGFDSRHWQGFFLLATAVFGSALVPNQPPIQWVSRAISQGREADHSPPSNAVVKNAWGYTIIPPTHLHDVVLN
jgi:hypothetical protein